MNQDLFEWLLLFVRWIHITTAVTWIGTSIFFMWMDRSFKPNPTATRPGHIGDLWMVHGGGFYHVEKLQMGPTQVPDKLHWFKWESYWTWMSGVSLVALIFYTGSGTFLLDSAVAKINFEQGIAVGLLAIVGSWFFYDFLWESKLTKNNPLAGHLCTILWMCLMSYYLCHTLSGRAAYLHMGAMMGTWMTANVFMRIIPRQVRMVEAAKRGQAVNQDWPKNAKNRSTHNTYLTLPVIFIMMSNHFPSTYGSEYNWIVLLAVSAAGAALREYFVVRIKNPLRSKLFGFAGIAILSAVVALTKGSQQEAAPPPTPSAVPTTVSSENVEAPAAVSMSKTNAAAPTPSAGPTQKGELSLKGVVYVDGPLPEGKKLSLPLACAQQFKGPVYSNEVMAKEGRLQNALVRITKGYEKLDLGRTPSTPVELDQRGCVYSPHLVVARVGQEVVFINNDPVFHNVKSFAKRNPSFNLAMPTRGQRVSKRFSQPEIPLQTKCSVHPWMGAFVAVLDHPFYSVSNERGEFEIRGLTPGTYTVELWHEHYGTQSREIAIGAQGLQGLDFRFGK